MVYLFDDLYTKYQKLEIIKEDLAVVDGNADGDMLKSVLEGAFMSLEKDKGKRVHLFDDFNLNMTEAEKKELVRYCDLFIHLLVEKGSLTDDEIETAMLILVFTRNILNELKQPELFYFFIETLFDILFKTEKFQFARDLGESCLICGYKDGMPELGYFLSFKIYSNTGSAIPALHYGICMLLFSLSKGKTFDHQFKGLIWSLVKFFRNIRLYDIAIGIYENRPKAISFSPYEEHSLTHTYFTTCLKMGRKDLPLLISEYLDRRREDIVRGGEMEVLPWLVTLHMCILNYDTAVVGVSECQTYIDFFNRVVDPEKIKSYIAIATGSSVEELISYLKKSLENLSLTRNELDFVTDNTTARSIANSLIRKSFSEHSIDGYLYSMIINSDYSSRFIPKNSGVWSSMKDYKINYQDSFFTPEELCKFIEGKAGYSFMWLGSDKSEVFPLVYNSNGFSFDETSSFRVADVKSWFFSNVKLLPLDDIKILPGNLKAEKEKGDYAYEEQKLASDLAFTSISVNPLSNILVIKDYELSDFPHNLALNKSGDFLVCKTPIINVLSLEWLVNRVNNMEQKAFVPTKGIWIPVNAQDYTLNYLYSFIEETLKKGGFTEEIDLYPKTPLNFDINIIAAHGDQTINSFPALFVSNNENDSPIVELDKIIGIGKVLIFFVCHSGSMTTDFLRNRIATLVRSYLKSGYEAVIAPFWALDISIPKYWLPAFLESIGKGNTVMQAAFDGNMKVRDVYPTPNAYACLHIYGNPFFRFGVV